MTVQRIVDKAALREFLDSDRVLYAYLLGDLEPALFEDSEFWMLGKPGQISAVALIYKAFELPVVQGLTPGEAGDVLWREMISGRHLPERFYGHFRGNHNALLHTYFKSDGTESLYKMRWDRSKYSPLTPKLAAQVVTLNQNHAPQIKQLVKRVFGHEFVDPRMLSYGVSKGVFASGELVSFAGVHVLSETYRVTSLGGICTHPNYRGRGYAAMTTGALLETLPKKVETVCLNVVQRNVTAVKLYQRLGFSIAHEYCEAILDSH